MSLPPIYPLAEAAEILGVSDEWLRAQCRARRFAALKRAGRWAMTEGQIEAAIDAMSTEARPEPAPSPSGLSRHSRFRRRIA
jgi:hypothetical protein